MRCGVGRVGEPLRLQSPLRILLSPQPPGFSVGCDVCAPWAPTPLPLHVKFINRGAGYSVQCVARCVEETRTLFAQFSLFSAPLRVDNMQGAPPPSSCRSKKHAPTPQQRETILHRQNHSWLVIFLII